MIAIQAVHHDSKYWPNPMKFDPSRFVNEKPKPYTFLPFIDGPRNCLGQYLALLESKMVISLLVQRYHLELVNKKDGDPRHKFIVPISPDGRMDVKCRRRKMNLE
jgi:cytochrome P450